MRYLLVLLISATVLLLLAGCNGAEAQIAVETTVLDLGDVPNGEIARRDLLIRNIGSAELEIENIFTSCGCTTATMEDLRLGPGESGTLHIEFDSGAHGEELTGPLMRQVFVNSNDPAQPELTLELAVNVTPAQHNNGD